MVAAAGRGRHADTDRETHTSGSNGTSSLEPDEIYHILQTRRRRDVLRYLRTADEPVALRDLAEEIAAAEHGTTVENLSSSQRQRVYISLYQSHLPKLDSRGIVDYDKDRGTIESTARTSQFDPYLDGLEESTADPWPYRYAGALACSGLVLAVIGSGLVPITWAGGAVFVVVLIGLVTALHAYDERRVE